MGKSTGRSMGIPAGIRRLGRVLAVTGALPLLAGTGPEPLRDLPYKSGPGLTEYERSRCKLDLYLPGKPGFPVLVWFHGGGLTEGTKDREGALGRRFASQGIAVAMVNYRLSPQVRYPEYVRDAAFAVAWVSRHIAQYGGDPALLFVGGHSAGAYLTMEAVLDPSHLEAAGAKGLRPAGLVPASGQMATHGTVLAERGDKGPGMRVDEAAPLFHVKPGLCPILNLCAERDDWKRLLENRTLHAYLQAMGVPGAELHIIPGRDHVSLIDRIGQPGDEVAARIQGFIEARAAVLSSRDPK